MKGERSAELRRFVTWCAEQITGDEKGQAQIFLDRLFQALGHKGCLDVGGTSEFRIRKPKESGGGIAFADYVWKPHVLIEMKKRGEDLSKHYRQAFEYWVRLVPGRPRYVVLCNFDHFWIYDFETQMDTPVDQLPLAELPDRWGPLAFLFPSHERPVFGNDQEQVTRDAAGPLSETGKDSSTGRQRRNGRGTGPGQCSADRADAVAESLEVGLHRRRPDVSLSLTAQFDRRCQNR